MVASKLNHEALLSFLRVSSLLYHFADNFFYKLGTSDAEFNILMTLNGAEAEGMSQKELTEELVIKKSNMVGLIDKLEAKGFVERKKVSGDRRLNRICLTEEGQKFLKKREKLYLAEVDQLMETLTKKEKESLIEFTLKMQNYLQERIALGFTELE